MKKLLTFLAAVSFAATAFAQPAGSPRAAEEPSATVISTDAQPPRAKKQARPVASKKHSTARKAAAKKTTAKKAAKGRHTRVAHAR